MDAGPAVAGEGRLVRADSRRLAAVAVVGSVSILLALSALLRAASAPGPVDSAIGAASVHWFGSLDAVLDAVEDGGDVGAVLALCVAITVTLAAVPLPRFALLAVLGPAVSGLGVVVLKPTVGRTLDGHDSFPSGHVTGFTAVVLVLALLAVRGTRVHRAMAAATVGAAALIAALLTGVAVVVAGVHYPSDVLGGLCTAVAGVLGSALVVDAVPTGRPFRPGRSGRGSQPPRRPRAR